MNQMVTISYEDQVKARARQRHLQLYGKPKVVNLVKFSQVVEQDQTASQSPAQPRVVQYPLPTAQMRKNEPRHHMDAWASYLDALRELSPARRFVKMQCFIHCVTYKDVCSDRRPRYLTRARRQIVNSTHEAFPDLSTTQIGNLINKDHTSVLNYLGRLRCKSQASREWREKRARAE